MVVVMLNWLNFKSSLCLLSVLSSFRQDGREEGRRDVFTINQKDLPEQSQLLKIMCKVTKFCCISYSQGIKFNNVNLVFILNVFLDANLLERSCEELCLNGGSCIPTSNGTKCLCPFGFFGDRCQNNGTYLYLLKSQSILEKLNSSPLLLSFDLSLMDIVLHKIFYSIMLY